MQESDNVNKKIIIQLCEGTTVVIQGHEQNTVVALKGQEYSHSEGRQHRCPYAEQHLKAYHLRHSQVN